MNIQTPDQITDQSTETRICSKCKAEKPATTEFFSPSTTRGHVGGFYPSCRECKRIANRDYAGRNRQQMSQRSHDWYEANKDRSATYNRQYLQEIREEQGERFHLRRKLDARRHREIGNPNIAIEEGKTSPTCKIAGFALVRILNPRSTSGPYGIKFRAAILNRSINAGERVVCHYTYIQSLDQWVCHAPPLGSKTEADRKLLIRLMKREKKTAGKGRNTK